jgi:heme-degrading monooxygenase HmoA
LLVGAVAGATPSRKDFHSMFLAMNRFQVTPGRETDFEEMWRARESFLPGVDGFVAFHLLKGPSSDDHTLYATHTVWESREAFEAWTKSDAFRAAHAQAGAAQRDHLQTGSEKAAGQAQPTGLYAGAPKLETFEDVQEILAG